VLAVTSHTPHLIAYTMVGVADDLRRVTDSEVIKYSAAGFRDFTRIAASDPTMWRDVFLTNKDATLEILGRFTEELFALQRAIRMGDGDHLHAYFTRTRAIRRGIIEAGQDTDAPDFGRPERVVGRKGAVCGDPDIQGEVLAPITSRVRGCGIENPVRVTSVAGVTLSQSAIVNCQTARALKDWVATGLKPAFGRKEVAGLRIAASYSCRPRNNIKGAKISEHGRGNAVDIAAIILANGKTVSVAEDWRRSAGRPMKKAYRAACGTFGTTLGPDADRHHRDHLHFDMAAQRNGAYCR
jgi:hypothetical protein